MSMKKYALIISALTLVFACNKTPKSEDSGKAGETKSEELEIDTSGELAGSYPEGMNVTAFPQAVDPSPGVAATGTVAVTTALQLVELCPPPPQQQPDGCTPPDAQPDAQSDTQPVITDKLPAADGGTDGEFNGFTQHPKVRLADNQKRLNGEASDCFSGDIIRAIQSQGGMGDACFGFDYGIIFGAALGNVDAGKINPALSDSADQSLSGLKTALSSIVGIVPDTTPEACMVKIGRQMVETATGRLEGSLRLFEGMLCQAKKKKIANGLPAVGKALDLTSAFSDYKRATVTDAKVRRLADKDGRPVYRSRIKLSPKIGKPIVITLVHSPGVDGNTEYDGVLWFETERWTSSFAVVTNISYSKSGTTIVDQRLKMEVRTAEFNKAKVTGDYISKDGRIDFNVGADANGSFGPGMANEYIEGVKYFAFDINPSSYAGNISFWNNPGGNYEEAARGFIFESSQNTDGTLSGCAYAGAYREGSIRKAVKEGLTLEPTGCYTPFLRTGACGANSPNPNDNVGPETWKQCFKQGTDGLYVIDTDKMDSINKIESVKQGFEILGTKPTYPVLDVKVVGSVGEIRDQE